MKKSATIGDARRREDSATLGPPNAGDGRGHFNMRTSRSHTAAVIATLSMGTTDGGDRR
jgi:hypothetical protein